MIQLNTEESVKDTLCKIIRYPFQSNVTNHIRNNVFKNIESNVRNNVRNNVYKNLFIHTKLPAEAGGWLSGLPFGGGKKAVKDGEAPLLDLSALELAAARGAQHAFVLLKGDAAILECVTLLKNLPLCATLIAPEEGVTVASTPGWVCEPLQDHDGSLLGPLAVRDGWDAPASAVC